MKKIYSIQEIADLLGYSIASIYSYERRGYIQRINNENRNEGAKFSEEQVECLLAMKKKLDAAGNSLSDLARTLGIHPGKVKEAVKSLKMDVRKVQTSLYSTRKRYALTSEQEHEIIEYLNHCKTGRPRQNCLHYTHMNLARHQLFLIEGQYEIRLSQDASGKPGFQMTRDEFLPYKYAIKKYTIEPAYSIVQTLQKVQSTDGFTDLLISSEDKDFYAVLDHLYRICGIRNFNAHYQHDKLFLSIRNGNYHCGNEQGLIVKELLNDYLIFGNLSVLGNHLSFSQPEKIYEVQLNSNTHQLLNKEAQKAQVPLNVWIQQILHKEARMLEDSL